MSVNSAQFMRSLWNKIDMLSPFALACSLRLMTRMGNDAEVVGELLRRRPCTLLDLEIATGFEKRRVSIAVLTLQRDGELLLDLGDDRTALLFLPSPTLLERLRRVLRARHAPSNPHLRSEPVSVHLNKCARPG